MFFLVFIFVLELVGFHALSFLPFSSLPSFLATKMMNRYNS